MENRASKIHERALRLVYDDSQNLPFEELLVKGNSVSIHQILATEIFKARHYYNSLRNRTKPFILALNTSYL